MEKNGVELLSNFSKRNEQQTTSKGKTFSVIQIQVDRLP